MSDIFLLNGGDACAAAAAAWKTDWLTVATASGRWFLPINCPGCVCWPEILCRFSGLADIPMWLTKNLCFFWGAQTSDSSSVWYITRTSLAKPRWSHWNVSRSSSHSPSKCPWNSWRASPSLSLTVTGIFRRAVRTDFSQIPSSCQHS